MGELERLDAAFSRLLFDAGLRQQLRAGNWSGLGESSDILSTVDLDELDKLAAAVRDGLVSGRLGGLGIGNAFPGTIMALGAGANQVVEHFLAATGGASVGGAFVDATGRRAGVSVLEAFHTWATTELAVRPGARCRAQHELAAALVTALARTPRPGFLVGWPLIRAARRGFTCVLDGQRPLEDPSDRPDDPVIYAAAAGRYLTGSVSVDLAAVVLSDTDDPPDWVDEHLVRLGPGVVSAARRAFERRGLA